MFKTFLASCLGTFAALLILFLITVGIFGAIVGSAFSSANENVVVAGNSVLQLNLAAPIAELQVDEPLGDIFPGAGESNTGLIQLKLTLARAKDDANIEGIFLNLSTISAGISTVDEIRQSILDFKSSGKWVIAYSNNYSEGAYFLASAADKVFLNPEGEVELNGLAISTTFFKKMLDKLEIKPEVFKVGDFKSAVEPFLREDMSEPNKLQLNSMIHSIYGQMLTEIAASRKIPKDRLKEISDKMLVRNAAQAVSYGLVDSLYYEDQVFGEIRSRLGLEKDKKIPFVKYSNYRKTIGTSRESSNEIAVIVADGAIMPGESNSGVVGGETIVEELRKARISSKVKAIVLRINSPGGSFQASDEMWREVVLTTKEKPVIASMSDYAASGGYYLAMACDTIVAAPTTITGSIGIFSVLWDLSGFLENKIGITNQEVKTGEIGSLFTVTRPLTPVEQEIWQTRTNEIYETFTGKAAKGRRMSQDDIKKIASGRVWTGEQAKNNGLVDILGNYQDAINVAAAAAKIAKDDYYLRYYPRTRTFLERFTGNMEGDARAMVLKHELGNYYPWFQQWEHVKKLEGPQARLPYELRVSF